MTLLIIFFLEQNQETSLKRVGYDHIIHDCINLDIQYSSMTMKRWFLLLALCFSTPCLAQNINVQHYAFTIKLNDEDDYIEGIARITFSMIQPSDSVLFDLVGVRADGKGMKVTRVIVGNSASGEIFFSQHDDKLVLPANNIKKDSITISVFYRGIPADGLIISKNKFHERTFFGDNWPNRAHNWLPCNDRPDDKASFEFVVIAPSQYQVISNGLLQETKPAGKDLTRTHWKETTPLSTKVMVIGVANFAVKQYGNASGNIPVSAWVYPKDSTKGFYDYATAPDIINFYSQYVAPFPYKKLANVQSTTIFGGMENASSIFYAENLVTGNRRNEDVVAHEIAHQWFGDMASEKSFAHLWLSEGFATFFTNLWTEYKYGKDSANKRLQKDRNAIRSFVAQTNHAVVDSTKDLMFLLNANSYQKGGWILHMLRNETGDPIFQKIIQTYYNQYKGGNAETRDFERVVEYVTGKDWKPFFDQWFYQPGIPKLKLEREKDKNEVKIKLSSIGNYSFPLELGIVTNDGKTTIQKITVSGPETTIKLKAENIKNILIDPNTKLLYQ